MYDTLEPIRVQGSGAAILRLTIAPLRFREIPRSTYIQRTYGLSNNTLEAYRKCTAPLHLDYISTGLAICGSGGSFSDQDQVVNVRL
jgi:hypothetical protein